MPCSFTWCGRIVFQFSQFLVLCLLKLAHQQIAYIIAMGNDCLHIRKIARIAPSPPSAPSLLGNQPSSCSRTPPSFCSAQFKTEQQLCENENPNRPAKSLGLWDVCSHDSHWREGWNESLKWWLTSVAASGNGELEWSSNPPPEESNPWEIMRLHTFRSWLKHMSFSELLPSFNQEHSWLHYEWRQISSYASPRFFEMKPLTRLLSPYSIFSFFYPYSL